MACFISQTLPWTWSLSRAPHCWPHTNTLCPAPAVPPTQDAVPPHSSMAGSLTGFRDLLTRHLQTSFSDPSILKVPLLTVLSLLYFSLYHLLPCDILIFYWFIANCGSPEGELLKIWELHLLCSLLYPWNSAGNWLTKYLLNKWMNEWTNKHFLTVWTMPQYLSWLIHLLTSQVDRFFLWYTLITWLMCI